MRSSSSGAVRCSAPALWDLCHCSHSTQNNFCCAFFVSIVYGHLCLNKGTAPSIWHFCRCCLETVRQASTWCFSSWFLFSQEFESLMQLVFISFFESIFMSALWGFLIHVYLKCDVFHFWNQIFIPANNILESHLPALSCLSARLEQKNLSQNKSNKPWQV